MLPGKELENPSSLSLDHTKKICYLNAVGFLLTPVSALRGLFQPNHSMSGESLIQAGRCNIWVMVRGSVCIPVCSVCAHTFGYALAQSSFTCLCCESTEVSPEPVGKAVKAGSFLCLRMPFVCLLFEWCGSLIRK